MRASDVVLALGLGLAVGGASGAGCSTTKSDHPPQLGNPAGALTADNPVECFELVAASDELLAQVPGPLQYDGGPAECLVAGTSCPIRDSDAGVCDGGHDAAVLSARCESMRWLAVCTSLSTDAGADGDGGVP